MAAPVSKAATWVEDLARRVGYRGLGSWLPGLGGWLGTTQPFPPLVALQFVTAAGQGVAVRLHDPDWRSGGSAAADAWVLYDVTLARGAPLPFGLDTVSETPATARAKLSSDISWDPGPAGSGFGPAVTHFLPDLRVVIVRFGPGSVGVDQVTLTRLFDWPDWRAVGTGNP